MTAFMTTARRGPRRRLVTIAIGAVTTAAVGVVLAGCTPTSASSHAETIVLYNAQHEQTTTALVAAFTKKTGIQVKVDNDDEDVLTAKVEQEGSRSPADVIYTENSNWLQQLDDRKLLSTVDAATLAHVPTADSAANGKWVAVTARVSALVYNLKDVAPADLPTSVMQLADPKWKGKLELAPAETDFWPVVSSVDHTYGDAATLAWLKALKVNAGANDGLPDNETLTADVSKGLGDLGVINHYYFYRLRAEVGKSSFHAGLHFFAPGDAGYIRTISGAAVLASSKHQAAAQKFVNFITSPQGQTVIAHSASFEYPLAAGVAANSELPAISTLSPNAFSPAEFGTGEDAKKLLQEAQLL